MIICTTKLNEISNKVILDIASKYAGDSTIIKQILIELNNGMHLSNGKFNFIRPDLYHNMSHYEQNICNEAENLLNMIIIEMKKNSLINKYIINGNDKNQVIQFVKILANKTEQDISNFLMNGVLNEFHIKTDC